MFEEISNGFWRGMGMSTTFCTSEEKAKTTMLSVTLNGIKRRGLTEWKGREWWVRQIVCIWSREHGAWWRSKAQGYTDQLLEAGVYEFSDAWERTKHCGPEKRIGFYVAPDQIAQGAKS